MAGEDTLNQARELLDNYWNRDQATDADLDTQLRIAELLTILTYATIALAERTNG